MNDRSRLSLLVLVATAAFLVISCSSKYTSLRKRMEGYSRIMKWGAYTAAGNFIHEDSKQEVMKKILSFMKGKDIVDFGIVDVSFDENTNDATAIVQYAYIDQRTQSYKAYNEMQLWKKAKTKWYLSKIISAQRDNPTHLD